MLERSGDFSHARVSGVEGRSSLYSYSFAASCDLYLKVQKGVASPCALRMSDFLRRSQASPARPAHARPQQFVQLQLCCIM